MSVLVLQLPPRERLAARAAGAEGASGGALRLPAEWPFVYSADGKSAATSGSAAAPLLPKADQTVLVLAEADVSWHRLTVPRAPSARMRAALLGVMEDNLLDDDAALHFALGAGAEPGRPGWVAVTHKPRLAAALTALEAAGHSVARVVAALRPAADAAGVHGHLFTDVDAAADSAPLLAWAGVDGAACLRLNGALARAYRFNGTDSAEAAAAADGAAIRWTATPAAAAAAERWLDAPVTLLSDAERALEAVAAPGNLRQFDLAARHRGTRAVREGVRQFLAPEWRPVRWGVAVVLAAQLLGLNAYAWQQRQALQSQRQAMSRLLQTAHPGVRAVLDAPVQMQRETDRLRAAAGVPGETDLEALVGAADAAWPDGQGPVQSLRFEGSRLSLAAAGFGEPQLAQLKSRLKPAGLSAELAEGRIAVFRAAAVNNPRGAL